MWDMLYVCLMHNLVEATRRRINREDRMAVRIAIGKTFFKLTRRVIDVSYASDKSILY